MCEKCEVEGTVCSEKMKEGWAAEQHVMAEFISVHDRAPVETGWYAILICWEPREGFFPSAAYWDGKGFTIDSPVLNFVDIVFSTEEEANKFAEENDPNW